MRILVLDPGEKVGWATATLDPDVLVPLPLESGDVIQTMPELTVTKTGISALKPMALATYKALVTEDKYDLVIYETWRLAKGLATKFAGSDFPSVQFIGMVRLACWLNGGVKVAPQPPANMRAIDPVLPKLYPEIHRLIQAAPASHDESHDTSALRHLAFWHFKTYVKGTS